MTTQLSSTRSMSGSMTTFSLMPYGWVLIILGLLALISSAAYAQQLSRATVSGRLMNTANQPVEFATVMLLKADSTVAKSTTTDTSGRYELPGVMPGTYRVAATMVGYQKALSPTFSIAIDQLTVPVSTILLREDRQTLSEVNVVAKKPFVEQLPDKTVLNVSSSIVATGGTALDVLERAPGVLVDQQNERITLKGREGTLVMIDGKPTYLSAQEVVNLLRNTPSNAIETIELISNPSAKYDAAGNAGIINIRLKRGSRAGGTNGSATLGGGYGRFPKATAGLTLSHRVGRLSLYGNYTYDYRKSYGTIEARRQFGSGDSLTNVQIAGYRPNTARNHTFQAGGDYELGKRTTVGLQVNGLLNNSDALINNQNTLTDGRERLQQTNVFDNASTRALQRLSANANLKRTFDTSGHTGGPRELTVDLDFSRVTIQPQDNMLTRYYDATGREMQASLVQRNSTPSTVTIRAAKADYVHPMGRGLKLEAGSKLAYVTSDNDVRFETLAETGYVPDPTRTNHFLYDETITAGYVNMGRERGKWNMQGGLRAEYTHSLGNSVTLNKVFERSYLNLFPSAFVTYTASPDHQWRASFSRRIDRPNYQDLNPFVYVMDPYTYREGNPFLRPQYTNAVQAGYTYKGETSLSLSYNHTTDVITGVNEQLGQQLRVTTVNLAALNTINLSVSTPIKLTRWWTIRTDANVFLNAYNAEYAGQRLDYRQLSANLILNQSFVLPYGLTAELSGFYNSPLVYGQLHFGSLGQLSAGIQKSLWNKTANLRLNVSDLLNTMRPTGRINYGTTNMVFTNRWESRQARLTFTWNFGNQKLKTPRQRRSGVEDEQNRTGGAN